MTQKIALLSADEYGDKIEKTEMKAVEFVGGIEKAVQPGDKVLIKPNLVNNQLGENGDVTHFSLIGPIIRACHDAGAAEILVGDGSGDVDTPKAFVASGVKQVVERLSSNGIPVKLVDLNYDKNPKTNEFDRVSLGKIGLNQNFVYRIAHSVLAVDTIISMPKLKTHTKTGITVALKNFIGIAPGGYYGFPKWRGDVEILPHGPIDLSPIIQQTILDLNRIALGKYPGSPRERKYMAIVDGVVAGVYYKMNAERIPIWRPIKVGVVIAGTDAVAVDTISAKVMCFAPEKIDLITRAASFGFGTMKDIEISGNKVEEVRRLVPPPDAFLHIADKSIPGVRGKIYRQALSKRALYRRYKHYKYLLLEKHSLR